MATALPANVNLIQLLAASPGTAIVGSEPLESVQSGTSVAFTLNQVLTFAQTNFSVGNLAAMAGLSVLGVTGTATATVAAITGVAGQILAVNAAGTGLAFTGAPTLATSVTAPFFNASNTTNGYQIGGTTAIAFVAGYNLLFTPDAQQALLMGNSSDPSNYYKGGTHFFRDRSAVDWISLTMSSPPIVQVGQANATGSGKVQLRGPLVSGGTTSMGYLISTASNFGVFAGTGAPGISAATSSLYLRNDATSSTTRLYINLNGASSWTAIAALA